MASDIIIIEDTPPSSPVNNEKNLSEIEVLDLTLDEFSDPITSSNPSNPWEQLRNKFIKNNMDLSLVDKIIDNPEITCEVINLTKTKCGENSLDTQKETTSNVPQSGNDTVPKYNYYPGFYNFKPENIQIGSYCFPVYENRTCLTPFPYAQQLGKTFTNYYAKNYMSNAKLNETMKYAQPNLMQRAFYNFPDDCSSQFMPEYIDINNFMNYNFNKSPTSDLTFDKTQQTTEDDTRSTAFKNNKRYNKNSVPLFLKRNRSVNTVFSCNKMKVLDLSSDNLNEQKNINDITIEKVQESKDDDSDVVYVGAYARDPIYPELQPTIYKLPPVDINEQQQERRESQEVETFVVESSQSSDSNDACEKFHSEEKDNETDNSGVKGKRKRKPPVTVPRRNPKRQVQIEKDYLKLLDNVICESKKEVKVRKPKKANKSNSSDDKKNGESGNRRLTRQPTNCGAVYRPPSPLAKHHFRQWPVSGMHERPEFNPVSGKLEPFDSIIRNISANYQPSKKSDGASNLKSNKDDEIREENKSLSTLCHEMFHHVFAYGATVKAMQKEEKKTDEKDVEKINFMKDLSLLSDVCNPLNLTVQNKMESSDKEESSSQDSSLTIKELMENSLLLYCLTNHDIDRDQLSKYIETLDPDELIKWSNKEFDLIE